MMFEQELYSSAEVNGTWHLRGVLASLLLQSCWPSRNTISSAQTARKVAIAGIRVGSAEEAYRVSTANGAVSVLLPTTLTDDASGKACCIAEVAAYGDVVLRFVSGTFDGPFLPNFAAVEAAPHCFGLQRMDHCVGNVPKLFEVTDYLCSITGACFCGCLFTCWTSVSSAGVTCSLGLRPSRQG